MAFGYIFVDNRPDTPSDKQILSDIFGSCLRYPTIKFHRTRMEIIGLWKKDTIVMENRNGFIGTRMILA